jgi:hypothetical protein
LTTISWLRQFAPREEASMLAAALDPRPPEVPRIPELDRLERELHMSAAREFDLHYRLRPLVREIAATRLEQRGLRLDSTGPAVRELLGEDLWELVRPGRAAPRDRLAAGPGPATLRRMIESLESL